MADETQRIHLGDLLDRYGTRLGIHKAYLDERMTLQEARYFEEVGLDPSLLKIALGLKISREIQALLRSEEELT